MKKATVMTAKKSPTRVWGLGIAFLLLLVISALAAWILPRQIKALVTHRLTNHLSQTTGLPTQFQTLDFSLTRPRFTIKNLRFSNPEGFPSAELAKISKVQVQYVPSLAILDRPDLKRVEIDFEEFRLLRNEAGAINLRIEPPAQAGGEDLIDEVELNLDSVTYTDLSGGQPVQKTLTLELDQEVYRNVRGVAGIMEIVNWEILKRTGVEIEKEPQGAAPSSLVEEIEPLPSVSPPDSPPL